MSDDRQIRFWKPDSPLVAGMLRLEREDRPRVTYSDTFVVVVVEAGVYDSWYRGAVRTHRAGAINLKQPGEVHRGLRVHAPFTIQGAAFSPTMVSAAAAALGLRGPAQFRSAGCGPGEPASQLAFAMHAALVSPEASALERETKIAETLAVLLDDSPARRATRAVRLARTALHDSLADKITLDDLAEYAGLDKFHLVRAFRAEVGLPPYAYLTHARVARARELLQRGESVAATAHAVGFYDESQLHRHFRRIVGIAPGRFSKSFSSCEDEARRRRRAC